MNANAVLAASEKKDAAFQWISYLAEATAQTAITEVPQRLPAGGQSVADLAKYKTNKYMQVSLLRRPPTVTAWPAIPGTTVATQKTWQPLFQGALTGKNSTDAVMEGVATTLETGQ